MKCENFCVTNTGITTLHKLPSADLRQLLSQVSTNKNFEDAVLFPIDDTRTLIQSLDYYGRFIDDPYLFGQIAATAALADIYAKGGTPLFATAILSFPFYDLPMSMAQEILQGGKDQIERAGAAVLGGHTTDGPDTIYGLSITGIAGSEEILTNNGARVDDLIVMAGALGSGLYLDALKTKDLDQQSCGMLFQSLTRLPEDMVAIARLHRPSACTDISSYGLVGHLMEMMKGARLAGEISIPDLTCMDRAKYLAEKTAERGSNKNPGSIGNRRSFAGSVSYITDISQAVQEILFGPEMTGAMLYTIDPARAPDLVADLKRAGYEASIIGRFVDGLPGHLDVTMTQFRVDRDRS